MSDEPRRPTVTEAAWALNMTEGAIRGRIKRGTLRSVREGPTVYVLLDADEMAASHTDQAELISAKDETIGVLQRQLAAFERQLDAEREANRENRRIIAALTQRIPELPPASPERPPEAPETDAEPPQGTEEEPRPASEGARESSKTPQRGFWARLFGG